MEKIYNTIIDRRKELMGIAILMVLLYHLCCWPQWNNPLRIFGHWYIGVDIFLILSGFGLCFSYEKYNIKTFYYHRLIRIIPLYWFSLIIFFICNRFILDGNYSLKQFFYGLTTLSFWVNTGKEPNWYVSALVYFYLFFPVLYKISKKYPNISFFAYFTITLFILKYIKIEWYHNCFVSRIPIFVFGILLYQGYKYKLTLNKVLIISLLFWNVAIEYCGSPYFLSASICPALLIIGLNVLGERPIVNKRINNFLAYLGIYSYELFLSNGLTYITLSKLTDSYNIELLMRIIVYILCTILYGFIFIKISKYINRIIKK